MDERPNGTSATVVELLLREPEIVAWLEDYRRADDAEREDDRDPPAAA